ncbi:MAG TPA: thioredoxin domain-containing protein [Thermoanaerobaculia bacterium]|nr:thioredoxin domain-containing protein [Thermoanaerobaculia bacterium]
MAVWPDVSAVCPAFSAYGQECSQAAHCAGDQDQFWGMHDKLFSKGGAIPDAEMFRYAAQLNLDQPKFAECMTSGKYKEVWQASTDDASKVGVAAR